MNVSYLIYESNSDLVTIQHDRNVYSFRWEVFEKEFNPPFNVDQILNINYEPNTGIYAVVRPVVGNSTTPQIDDKNSPEISWIKDNFLRIYTKGAMLDEHSKPHVYTIREFRSHLFFATDFYTIRHQEELSLGIPTTLNQEQYQQFLTYRTALRHIPTENLDTSDPSFVWPVPPSWIKNLPTPM